MPVAVILALIQAAAALIPEIAEALPAVEAALENTATEADVATMQSVTAALNDLATNQETAAGATGPTS